jgi:poly-gamma-glutamate synthesis protein (capsule biosynthesis protein)
MGEISLFLAGDSVITRPWSHVQNESFLRLIDAVRAADVSITNLETVIHEFNGYAQAHCGGTYMTSSPQIAAELRWAGFDMVAHANNHCFDYGSTGVLETISHVENAGLILAGSGQDLQNARAPRYICRNGGVLALVAVATDFVAYGKASYTRPDVIGRPGLNTLSVSSGKGAIIVPESMRRYLQPLASIGLRLRTGRHFGIRSAFQIDAADLDGNFRAISEATSTADIVVLSVHAHRQRPWLQKFAHQAIERGASLVFIHGPHEIRGIELFNGRPIFYSMGDFAFEPEYITHFPAEAYEKRGLPPDAVLDQATKAKLATPLLQKREAFEGFAASIALTGAHVARIQLIPIDLQFDAIGEGRGRPQLASPALGRDIIGRVAIRSKRFGTRIVYDADSNRGEVAIG